jgi:hypothetical protein
MDPRPLGPMRDWEAFWQRQTIEEGSIGRIARSTQIVTLGT